MGDLGNVIPSRDNGEFVETGGTDLREAGGGRECVADALAADGLLDRAALEAIVCERFGRAAVANGAV